MFKVVFQNPWVQAAAALAGVVLLCIMCYVLSPVLVPLLFAFLVAYALNPIVDFFERRRIPRMATIFGLAVLGILLVLAVPLILVPNLVSEADTLIQAAAEKAGHGGVSTWVDGVLNRLPLEKLVQYMGWAPAGIDKMDPRAIIAAHIGTYVRDHALQLIREYSSHFAAAGQAAGTAAAQMFASIGRQIVGLVLFLGDFALFAFVAGYLLKDFHKLIAASRDLVPPIYQTKTFDIVGKIDLQIRSFLRGQLLVCACLAIFYSTGLLISGTPFAVPIGLFGGIASFVPYLGVTLTIIPACLLTILQHGGDWHVMGVLVTFIISQTIEGTLLTPKIVGDQVGLSPVWVILAILVFANLLGFLGLLLAVPMAAVLKVIVLEGVEYYKRSSLFSERGAGDGTASGGEA